MNLAKSNPLAKPGRIFAYKQIGISVIIVLVCALVTYFVWGLSCAQSVLAGGIIGIIPNFVFAYKAFKYAGAKSSKLVVESFFSGVKLKMVLTATLICFGF